MRRFRGQRGASLIETMMAIGILGMVAYFVVGMIRNGTVGQKSLQASDDARVVTDNMAAVLSDPLACGYTLGGINPAAAQPTEFTVIKDAQQHPVYQKDSSFGSRSLKLLSMHVGGPLTPTPAKDGKTGIQLWTPLGTTGGTAFVSVVWRQTNMSGTTGAQDLQRYFLVNAMSLSGTGGILTCQATGGGGGGGGGHWTQNAAGDLYNTNTTGHVGIGTPAGPTNNLLLDVSNNGIAHGLTVEPVHAFVGVGTTSPSFPLHVGAGAGAGDLVQIETTASSNSFLRIQNSVNMLDVGIGSLGATAGMGYVWTRSNKFFIGDDGTPAPAFITSGTQVAILTTTMPTGVALNVGGDVQAGSFISTSDARLKGDVRPAEGLAKVLRLEGVTFRWLKDGAPGMGFLAQAVEKIFPDVVTTDAHSGLKAIRYEALLAPLVEAVKELHAMVEKALALGAANSAQVAELRKTIAERSAANRDLTQKVESLERDLQRLSERLKKAGIP
jgi:hypothetical protein